MEQVTHGGSIVYVLSGPRHRKAVVLWSFMGTAGDGILRISHAREKSVHEHKCTNLFTWKALEG